VRDTTKIVALYLLRAGLVTGACLLLLSYLPQYPGAVLTLFCVLALLQLLRYLR